MHTVLRLAAMIGAALLPLHAAMPASGARPVTIMPLGDSITEGGEGFSVYRYPLMEKLRRAGYGAVFTGSKTTRAEPGSPFGALAHEGHAGKNLAFILARFPEAYRAHPADILLVHAGHNQFADQNPVPGMLADTRSLVVAARSVNPRVVVLLAQVIPSGKLPKYSYIPAFNQALAGLAAELGSPASPVVLVDQASGFDWQTDTVADRVHPNARGAEKMAARWFEALVKVLPPPATATAAPSTLRLWPGDAPGLAADPGPEVAEAAGRVSHVSVPTLDVYLPAPGTANGDALVICSGGGYVRLASGPLGRDAAAVFNPLGYAVFSLKYRVRPPSADVVRDALADARRAVRLIRARSAEWQINPDRVGMIGFSAGANLVLTLATSAETADPSASDPLDRLRSRPDFVVLAATWANGRDISAFPADAKSPPAFILHARDDTVAPARFAEEIDAAWRAAGAPSRLTLFEKGGHMAFNFPVPPPTEWTAAFDAWRRTFAGR